MLDMIHSFPDPLRHFQGFDAHTAEFYAGLQELEKRLLQLSREYGVPEKKSVPSLDEAGVIELTDYLHIEDV